MKKQHLFGGLTASTTILGVIFLILWLPPHQADITQFAVTHPLLAPFIVIMWRILGVVIPPIPGGILSYALIPTFGWLLSFIYAIIGIFIGTSISFWIARKFREPVVARFVPLQQLHQMETKLSDKTEFFAFLGIRFTTAPVMDFISYIAGLSKISYKKFAIATVISLLPDGILFYLGDKFYAKLEDQSSYVAVGMLIAIVLIFYLVTNRKIFKRKGKDN